MHASSPCAGERTPMPRSSPRPSATAFGSWLAKARDLRGLSQNELAERAGITQEYVSGLERGVRNPSRKVIHALATALTPENADERVMDNMLNSGLGAAGFATEGQSELLPLSTGDAVIIQSVHPVPEEIKERIRDYAEYQLEKLGRERAA